MLNMKNVIHFNGKRYENHLAPSDFWLFETLKEQQWGQQFASVLWVSGQKYPVSLSQPFLTNLGIQPNGSSAIWAKEKHPF